MFAELYELLAVSCMQEAPVDLHAFLDTFFLSRIALRFLAGQHCALFEPPISHSHIGMVHTRCPVVQVRHILAQCQKRAHLGHVRGCKCKRCCSVWSISLDDSIASLLFFWFRMVPSMGAQACNSQAACRFLDTIRPVGLTRVPCCALC